MDHFGICQALKGAALIYFQSARQTGRTVSLVESLRDGDRIIFTNSREANRVKPMCIERGIKIDTMIVDPKCPTNLFDHGSSQGRTIFDHSWIEQFYLNALERCEKEINHFQRETSGFGEAHLETRRKAAEILKWKF